MQSYKSLKTLIRYICEGINDQYNDKLILFFGPPGAGKSTFIKVLKSYGLKHSTPDDILEFLIDKNLIKTKKAKNIDDAFKKYPEDIFSPSGIRGQALDQATRRLNVWKELPLGIVMEGTGGYPDWYEEEVIKPFSEIGYEVMIVMLYEDLQTCLERNIARGQEGGRNLPESLVASLHDGFVDNYNQFKNIAIQNQIKFTTISDYYPNDLDTDDFVNRTQGLKEIKKFLNK